jgi:hypothetical protein
MANMARTQQLVVGLTIGLVLGTLTGCASQKLNSGKSLSWLSKEPHYESPEKVIAIWTDTTYQLPGQPPTRGFGGRVYFYNAKGEVIPVKGDLVVYAYDDNDPHSTTDRPTRKYAFTADQLTRYYGESDLGASYNIWVPWDAVGGDEKQVALLPVFIDASGKMVRGAFANNRLPGKRNLNEEESRGFYVNHKRREGAKVVAEKEYGVRPIGYNEETNSSPDETAEQKESGLKSYTIRVPRSLSERMATAPLNKPAAAPATTGAMQGPQVQAQPAALIGQPAAYPINGMNATTIPNASPVAYPPQAPTGPLPPTSFVPAGTQPAYPGTAQPIAPGSAPQAQVPNGAATNANGMQTGISQPAKAPELGQQGFIGADPSLTVSARSRAWARQDSRSARFEQPQFRAPTSPGSRAHSGYGRTAQYPSAPQYYPPASQ